MTRADYTRTCAGCGSVVTEDWANGQKCFRCYEPGQTCGYIVGIERFLPYVPAYSFPFNTALGMKKQNY